MIDDDYCCSSRSHPCESLALADLDPAYGYHSVPAFCWHTSSTVDDYSSSKVCAIRSVPPTPTPPPLPTSIGSAGKSRARLFMSPDTAKVSGFRLRRHAFDDYCGPPSSALSMPPYLTVAPTNPSPSKLVYPPSHSLPLRRYRSRAPAPPRHDEILIQRSPPSWVSMVGIFVSGVFVVSCTWLIGCGALQIWLRGDMPRFCVDFLDVPRAVVLLVLTGCLPCGFFYHEWLSLLA